MRGRARSRRSPGARSRRRSTPAPATPRRSSQDSTGLEVRVFDGEVESLTEAGERGLGVRAWIDGRAGYAYGTDLTDDGHRARSPPARSRRPGSPTPTSSPPRPSRAGEPTADRRASPTRAAADWTTERKVELAIAVERAAREADERVVAVETTVFVDERAAVALASSRGVSGAYEATYLLRLPLGDRRARATTARPASASASGRSPAALDPEAIGARGGRALDRAARRGQARLAQLPGGPRRDRRRQLRRLHRRGAVRRRGPARALAVRRAPRRGDRLRRR